MQLLDLHVGMLKWTQPCPVYPNQLERVELHPRRSRRNDDGQLGFVVQQWGAAEVVNQPVVVVVVAGRH